MLKSMLTSIQCICVSSFSFTTNNDSKPLEETKRNRKCALCNMLFTGFTKATVRMLYEVITLNIFLSINNCFYRNKLIIFGVDSAAKHRQALPSVTFSYPRSNVDFI